MSVEFVAFRVFCKRGRLARWFAFWREMRRCVLRFPLTLIMPQDCPPYRIPNVFAIPLADAPCACGKHFAVKYETQR